jgi:uncharacterized protein YbaP (TraB family)
MTTRPTKKLLFTYPVFGGDAHRVEEAIVSRTKADSRSIRESEKRTVIYVGAGHLGGPEGLLALLERSGHPITPLLKP